MTRMLLLAGAIAGVTGGLGGCGGGDYGEGFAADARPASVSDAGAGTPACFSSSECPVGMTCSEFGTCEAISDPGTPPAEIEYALSEPVRSRRFVWVAMTDQDRLARIDAQTLAVDAIGVGEQPKVVATLPGTDTAVVLDAANATATVVRPTDGASSTEVYRTLPNLNRLAVTPGGRYALAYFDLSLAISEAGSLENVGAIGSFQDVTVLSLEPGAQRAVDLTVGFRPRAIKVDETGRYAFVITDDGVSVIDLPAMSGAPTIVPPVPLYDDPTIDGGLVEVDIVASGAYAIARAPNTAALRVVRLLPPNVGASWDIPLDDVPSDLDVAPDGSRIFAVLRDPASLIEVELPTDVNAPIAVRTVALPGAQVGSLELAANGRHGLLFTNAALDEHVTVVALDDPNRAVRTFALQKAVRTVGFDPRGAKLIVLHARAPGDPDQATNFEQFVDRSHGYSVVDLATGFAKLQLTEVNPEQFAFAPDDPRAYVTLDGTAEGGLAAVQQIELDTGVVRTIELMSAPESLGAMPATDHVFVSQTHPLGRVTFIDVTTGLVRTLTGFDLNSRVID